MAQPNAPRIAIGPTPAPHWIAEAVIAGGGHVVDVSKAQGLVWADAYGSRELAETLDNSDHLAWVQLPFAGVENFIDLVDDQRQWTCGKGIYADPVAELALGLALAGMRGLGIYARANTWQPETGRSLIGARVTILGGGGITDSLLRLLKPFDCHTTVVRNRVQEMDGADVVVEADRYTDCLPGADLVVLALPLTPETEGMIGRNEFEMMERDAWVINVARGRHIITDDLVWALRNNVIGGAGLDVTDPEPLPDGHPLWSLPNCIITPHTAAPARISEPLLAERITQNVRLFATDQDLVGPIFLELGY
jgi:phosphoglycerate dehydrogenase-like enzyme